MFRRKKPQFSARDCALGLVARRDHSRYDLERKLKLRQYSAEEVREALEFLENSGYLREERYAQIRARDCFRKGMGIRGIQARLASEKLRVETSQIREWLAEEGLSEEDSLRKLLMRGKTPRHLLSKGFEWDEIKRLAAELGLTFDR